MEAQTISEFDYEQVDVAEEREVFIPTSGGDMKKAEDYKAIWNLSSNSLGCIASKGYHIIQHREVIKSLFTALKNLNINFTFNLKKDNHRIFMDIRFPDVKLYVDGEVGEEFIGGLRLVNSYDKTTGLLILPRLERLVCSNGMVVRKFVGGFTIRHNQKLILDFERLIERAMNDMINGCDKLKAMVSTCIADSIEWDAVETVLENLIFRKKHIEPIFEIIKKKDVVTRWDIYNAVTQYATHSTQIKPSIEAWLQNKAEKLLETPLEVFNVEKEIEVEVK